MFDYESLRLIAWSVVGLLLIGFAITDGFDLGVAALLPVLGKTNTDRRIMINAIAPHWDGNQVWLITAGGAIFAIWPTVYGVTFSGFYLAMVLALAALWLRPIGMDFRAKIDNPKWRNACDCALVVSGIIPPVIFGVGFGNLLLGVPFEFNSMLAMSYQGGFWDLLTPFPLLCGVISLMMMITQGASFSAIKTTGELQRNARQAACLGAYATMALFAAAGIYAISLPGYLIDDQIATQLASNPLTKHVSVVGSDLLHNYKNWPVLWLAPAMAGAMLLVTAAFTRMQCAGKAFYCSSVALACIILTAGIALFPMIVPSSWTPNHSLTIWDASSSQFTLSIVLLVALVMVPIILGYTAWCYYKMFGKVDQAFIKANDTSLY